jgi:hypothetical protein
MLGQATRPVAHQGPFTLSEAALRQLAALLVAAAIAETLFLRLATRVGVHVPRGDIARAGIHVASLLGTLALNLASVLAIGLVVLVLALLVLRMETGATRLALTVLSTGMLWGLGSTLTTDSLTGDALFGLTMTLLVVCVGFGLARRTGLPLEARVAIGLMVVAYACYQYYALSHLLYRVLDYSTVPPLALPVLRLGEGLVVVAGAAAFWAWGARRWRQAGFAGTSITAAAVLIVAAGSLAPAATTSILSLWTTGLSLFLPLPLYLLSLGLYLLTVIACLRSGEDFWTGAGLLLVLLAGYMPEATYDHLLLLLGVAFLSGAMTWAVRGHARDPAELSTRT